MTDSDRINQLLIDLASQLASAQGLAEQVIKLHAINQSKDE